MICPKHRTPFRECSCQTVIRDQMVTNMPATVPTVEDLLRTSEQLPDWIAEDIALLKMLDAASPTRDELAVRHRWVTSGGYTRLPPAMLQELQVGPGAHVWFLRGRERWEAWREEDLERHLRDGDIEEKRETDGAADRLRNAERERATARAEAHVLRGEVATWSKEVVGLMAERAEAVRDRSALEDAILSAIDRVAEHAAAAGAQGQAAVATVLDRHVTNLRFVLLANQDRSSSTAKKPRPIDMVLHCPACGMQHVDAPEPERGWTNPPHKSHLCHGCQTVWRPADVPTNGVAAVKTRGEKDTWDPEAARAAGAYTRAQFAAAVDDAHTALHQAEAIVSSDDAAWWSKARTFQEIEPHTARAHEALHRVGAGLSRVDCGTHDPEATRIARDLLKATERELPCGHTVADLIYGVAQTGRTPVTKCGACLAVAAKDPRPVPWWETELNALLAQRAPLARVAAAAGRFLAQLPPSGRADEQEQELEAALRAIGVLGEDDNLRTEALDELDTLAQPTGTRKPS